MRATRRNETGEGGLRSALRKGGIAVSMAAGLFAVGPSARTTLKINDYFVMLFASISPFASTNTLAYRVPISPDSEAVQHEKISVSGLTNNGEIANVRVDYYSNMHDVEVTIGTEKLWDLKDYTVVYRKDVPLADAPKMDILMHISEDKADVIVVGTHGFKLERSFQLYGRTFVGGYDIMPGVEPGKGVSGISYWSFSDKPFYTLPCTDIGVLLPGMAFVGDILVLRKDEVDARGASKIPVISPKSIAPTRTSEGFRIGACDSY